jgi:hypothetical protein
MQDSQMKGPLPASRRRFFVGAATVGAVAATVAVLPKIVEAPAAVAVAPALPPVPENGGGYSLSEHVKRYYTTAAA